MSSFSASRPLIRRYPHSAHQGRHAPPGAVILRMRVVQPLSQWRDDETEHVVTDRLVWRQFCRLDLAKAPHATTLLRWANQIHPDTQHALLEQVVALARRPKVTRGRKLRPDGTVVASTIPDPPPAACWALAYACSGAPCKRRARSWGQRRNAAARCYATARGVPRSRARAS